MHAGRRYSLQEFLLWSRRNIYYLFIVSAVPVWLFKFAGFHWIHIPWAPVTLIGTAAALIAGFRNNATYGRSWEARQIWGAIVNSSRCWGIMSGDFIAVNAPERKRIQQGLIYRHIAWLTALRYQLREPRVWENVRVQAKYKEYSKKYSVQEWESSLEGHLEQLLSKDEINKMRNVSNKATYIIKMQSEHIARLNSQGLIDTLKYVEMVGVLKEFYEQQGQCERIKNFPYPRQYASMSTFFIHLFILMTPLGIISEFNNLGVYGIWLTIPFSMITGWVFLVLENVGESTENPFEGGANDIPITAMSRTIEIDLREMLAENDIPEPLRPVNNILM
ncbi:bestrophin family protein [Flavobacterium sp. F52]|uniref:bestrophin family protein n=1 Tax=Flavobacterium sp. F52 TaxID=1202532 RepID=UPI000272D871|nr:bestrophin family ion channel [Flavobacterium sp. F52]EJG03184.1 putative membrane protein [Flavobacterium sp. F52]